MKRLILWLVTVVGSLSLSAQITERTRPEAWKQLVPGARFMDRFLPMPDGIKNGTFGERTVYRTVMLTMALNYQISPFGVGIY